MGYCCCQKDLLHPAEKLVGCRVSLCGSEIAGVSPNTPAGQHCMPREPTLCRRPYT